MQGQTASYVITTLIAPPASVELTTLATVKDELDLGDNDTQNDAKLTRYITEESQVIARYCNRVFGIATWQDEFRPQRGVLGEGTRGAFNPLKLTRWPLAVQPVNFIGNTHTGQLIDDISNTSQLEVGMPVFGPGIPVGASIASVEPFSILITPPATASAAAQVLAAGMSVIETLSGVPNLLVAGTDFEIQAGSLLPGDEGPACLYRLNENGQPRTWPSAQILVIYQAGYVLPNDDTTEGVSLPSDLSGTAVRIVTSRFGGRKRDPLLRSRTQPNLGTEEYWVGAMPGQSGPYPNLIMGVLDKYRTPVVA